jgi:hypothetical protein
MEVMELPRVILLWGKFRNGTGIKCGELHICICLPSSSLLIDMPLLATVEYNLKK